MAEGVDVLLDGVFWGEGLLRDRGFVKYHSLIVDCRSGRLPLTPVRSWSAIASWPTRGFSGDCAELLCWRLEAAIFVILKEDVLSKKKQIMVEVIALKRCCAV